MKKLLFLSFVTLGLTARGQLYVQPTTTKASYVFVDNALFFVNQDIELATNSTLADTTENKIPNILLRGQGLLLQGQGTDRANKGTGVVSIYQEGTVNQYDYNFWASPVGLSRTLGSGIGGPARVNGNTPFAFRDEPSEKVFTVPLNVTDSDYAINNTGYDGFTNPGELSIAHYWLYSYKASSAGYAAWGYVGNTEELESGYGFSMKGVSGTDSTTVRTETIENNPGGAQRYDFRGRPNNGDISGVTVESEEFVLVGNPYPSAFDLSYFLVENSAETDMETISYPIGPDSTNVSITRRKTTTGIAYFWDSKPNGNSHYLTDYQGGYGTFSPMGDPLTAGVYVPATYQNYDELGNGLNNDVGGDGDEDGGDFKRRFSPVGQGFFVQGDSLQGTTSEIIFSNRHRVYVQEGATNNSEFRSLQNDPVVEGIGVETYYPDVTKMEKISKVYLAVGVNDTYSRQLAIGLLDSATEEFDFAIDAPINGELNTDAAFATEYTTNNNILGCVIAGVPLDEYQWIPLKIKVEAPSELKFKIHRVVNFDYENIYLMDKVTETYYNILGDDALISLEEGIYEDRFYVRFTTETAPPEDVEDEEDISVIEQDPASDETIYNSFIITQNNDKGQLEIYNPDNIKVKDMALYDIAGKQIFKELDLGTENNYTIPTNNLSTGIYVVQFVTIDGLLKAQKVRIIN